ncbi:DENN domain-containing protein 11 [Geodia barretti]|nr:DENN domain-containing protein 11 [Geodia barretti]
MARQQEERVPLLSDEELPEDDLGGIQVSISRARDGRRAPHGTSFPSTSAELTSGGSGLSGGEEREEGQTVGRRRKHYSGNEMIVSVFVVQFNIRKGNEVEWRHPEEVNLEGIEFKCIASGSHNIPKDFIYFKQGQLFGLSCFEKIKVQSEEERGVRMKSVGLLAVGYQDLHLHQQFLERQARGHVETPGHYGSLEEYFTHYRSPRHSSNSVPRPLLNGDQENSLNQSSTSEVVHPVGAIPKYLEYFGPHIFVLWKLALLKKRILIFSPPPIGVVCYRVYCTCLLTDHSLGGDLDLDCNPMFYVNVNDIDSLRSTRHYVACTSEQILQSKTELYDVFVDQQRLVTHLASLDHLLRITPADKERYDLLNSIR